MTGIAHAKDAMLSALRVRDIATVIIAYDGECDTRRIGHIAAHDAKKQPVGIDDPVQLALYETKSLVTYASLREAIHDFAWLLLEHFHDGFEVGEGGYGRITIRVPEKWITIEHEARFVETVTTRTEA
jgi:hypothetical protein